MPTEIRAAIYGRVSSDLQEKEQTIRSQLEGLRKYVLELGSVIAGEYIDDGYSGATLDRPGLDRLRDALRIAEMDVVVFHSPDRLARKAVYQGLVLEEIEKAGVRMEFLNYPVDDAPKAGCCWGCRASLPSTNEPKSWNGPEEVSSIELGRGL